MLVDENPERLERLREQLLHARYTVIAEIGNTINLHQQVRDLEPDAIIIGTDSPDRDTLENLCVLSQDSPRPIVMFTHDGDTEQIRAATRAGVCAYVVGGMEGNRMRPIMDAAIARFEESQTVRSELAAANLKLNERKLVERAKGVLMKQRGLGEEEAYSLMRKMAMDRNIKLADLASQVVEAAKLLL
jgi:two-component system, response regulator / RNA-binding antiterminator